MVKRFAALLLVIACIAVCSVSAFADSELTVTQKKIIPFSSWMSVLFAKVENTGDAGCYVGTKTKLVALDESGETLASVKDISHPLPLCVYLEPGEYAYVGTGIYDEVFVKGDFADFEYSVKPETIGFRYDRFECESELVYQGTDSDDNYVKVDFTNETSATIDNPYVLVAIYDQNDELVYVQFAGESWVDPGETATLKFVIDKPLVKYYEDNGIELSRLDVLGYY